MGLLADKSDCIKSVQGHLLPCKGTTSHPAGANGSRVSDQTPGTFWPTNMLYIYSTEVALEVFRVARGASSLKQKL